MNYVCILCFVVVWVEWEVWELEVGREGRNDLIHFGDGWEGCRGGVRTR